MNNKREKILVFSSLFILFDLFEIFYYDILIFLLKFQNFDYNLFNYINMNNYNLYLIKYAFIIVIILLFYKKYLKSKWFDFKKNFNNYFQFSIRNWLIGLGIMMVSNMILIRFIGSSGTNEEAVQGLITNNPIVALIMTSILAPFVEEMIFRKSLQDCFRNKKVFIIASGFIFGLLHVIAASNIVEYLLIIPYGALGGFFAYTLSETDNIYCSIMTHVIHNLILTLLSIFLV